MLAPLLLAVANGRYGAGHVVPGRSVEHSFMRLSLSLVVLGLAVVLVGCPEEKPGGGGIVPSSRCEADLDALGLFSQIGTGARARTVAEPTDLIGGQAAEGRLGDLVLENDRLRVIISQPGRHFGLVPYGGTIVDADLRRPEGTPGRDHFGRVGILHAFGRTFRNESAEILKSGEAGGAAVVAVTGVDAINDYINIQSVIGSVIPGVTLAIDPEQPRPLKVTTYYVLSPGETRVRMFTQLCNEGNEGLTTVLGDLFDSGGTVEFFNPQGCTKQMGNKGCLIDPTRGIGFQGDGVAYGYRSYAFDSFSAPSDDAILSVAGALGVLAGAKDSSGVLSWVDPQAARRPGTFGIRAGESRGWLRDFYVTRDLSELTSTWLVQEGGQNGRLSVTVTDDSGAPAPGARVSVVGSGNRVLTVLVADDAGRAKVDLPPATYTLYTGAHGHAFAQPTEGTVSTNGTTELSLKLGMSRTLTVQVADPAGAPMPAKVTVLCPLGTCPTPANDFARIAEVETLPTNVAAIAHVPPSGTLALKVPPGAYEVVVTRGPEFSPWPLSWPASGQPVDLQQGDQQLQATLARVVDSSGWLGADLHVHAVNSVDSSVANEHRVLTFLGEGVDVLVATDHDVVTDFAPAVDALGAGAFISTVVGQEISTFDFGHMNAFPISATDAPRGGPFDWGGGDGPTLRPTEIFSGVRSQHPDAVIQLNHPRGAIGMFGQLGMDTDTLTTQTDPLKLRMAPAPDATASDTRLFDANFDAIEVANGLSASIPLLNDWMTQLSSGRRKTATAVSDTHSAYEVPGGYSRTYVQTGTESTQGFGPAAFAQAIKAQRAFGTNGPFLRVSARKVDAGGNETGDAVGIGGTLSVSPTGGESVALTVEVQAPEWMRFDTIEVFTHADGRQALGGVENANWPAENVHRSVKLDPATLPIEAVPGTGGYEVNRIRVVQTFNVTPTADTWYVVIVRSSSSVGTLFPLAYDGVECDGNLCTAVTGRPYAFSNPVYVDADGSGAYDVFPQKIQRRSPVPKAPAAPVPRRVPTAEEADAALRELLAHDHD